MPIEFPASPSNADKYELWAWNAANSTWNWDVIPEPFTFEYVVVGGGGGGGRANDNSRGGGGGGAGGYRANVSGESSGGGSSAERPATYVSSDSFTVTVGAGGASITSGEASVFSDVTSMGGGRGGDSRLSLTAPLGGGSGGGGGGDQGSLRGTGVPAQGYIGAVGRPAADGGGGGGAGQVGGTGDAFGRKGGDGVVSEITGSSVYRAGGGSGGGYSTDNVQGGGGPGGAGSGNNPGQDGDPNTGGGGGGGFRTSSGDPAGGQGGSGIVILKYPASVSLTIGAGLTSTTDSSTVPGYKITTFTAGTDTVTIA